MRKLISVFISAFLIVGCTTTPIQVHLPQFSPTAKATIVPNSATITLLPTTKTLTSTIKPTSTNTILPDLTSIAYATQQPLFDKYCGGAGYFFNANWGICHMGGHNFSLFSLDGTVWKYSYDKLGIAREREGPDYMTRVFYTTKDGVYVYLMPTPNSYDPLGPFFGDGIALLRANLKNGDIHIILPPLHFYNISFSPTERRLAYVIFDKPLRLVIQDLQSGETKQIDLEAKYTQAGLSVWSGDGLKVAYMPIIDGDECFRKFAIRLLDIKSMSSTTIIDDTEVNTCQPADPTYYAVDVTGDSVILEQHGDIWNYNISTRQLYLQATATPKP